MANGAIYPLQYDLQKDFEPVGLIASQPFLINAKKSIPANDLVGLIDWLKVNANKASEGNSGIGTPSHIAGLLFQNAIGVHFPMVPYRGAGQSMQGLMTEETDMMLDTPAVSLAQVRAGTIKSFAVTASNRLAIAPEIPTTDEAGLPGFYFSFLNSFWFSNLTSKYIISIFITSFL
jgi:tripartite-type tricarboxylate transporter receptor subunit TctC